MGEVRVEDTIGVNVIKPGTVGAFVVDSHLMGCAPVGYVLFSEAVGLLLEHSRQLNALFRIPEKGSYVVVGFVADGAAGVVLLTEKIESAEIVIGD